MRTHLLQNGGSTGIHTSCSAPVLSFLCSMDKRTLIVPNTTICPSRVIRNVLDPIAMTGSAASPHGKAVSVKIGSGE